MGAAGLAARETSRVGSPPHWWKTYLVRTGTSLSGLQPYEVQRCQSSMRHFRPDNTGCLISKLPSRGLTLTLPVVFLLLTPLSESLPLSAPLPLGSQTLPRRQLVFTTILLKKSRKCFCSLPLLAKEARAFCRVLGTVHPQ